MILQIVFWFYLVNVVLLILHEMDSAYWKEWELFHLPGGIGGFLLIHFPLFLAGLYGLVLLSQGAPWGLILSSVVSAAGIFAFCIHTYFLRKGRPEFDTRASQWLLGLMLIVSIAQMAATIAYWLFA
ncbi:MAG: hypothetical protein JW748_13970 [Anaerolineales bacterium]|nr:hypothetical protein [Anaerolineales bacterium]